MNYSASLRFLDSFLNLEQIPKPHLRVWNLKRMRRLLEIFGHPERDLFPVLIAGTKGKGSTGYFLSEILRRSGLRVGFYHSPHLEEPRERIWIGGKPISRIEFAKGMLEIKHHLHNVGAPPQLGFTYFEIMTLLATLLFKERKVDCAVFEVGMGGRLDATHALQQKLSILTPIHYDHEAFLGNTLTEIAGEKADILAPHQDVVVAPQEKEALRVIQKVAKERNCRLWPPLSIKNAPLKLLGDFQRLNASMAVRAATVLRDRYRIPITVQAMKKGIGSNHWPGRMELFEGTHGQASLLLDAAHNPKSIEALCASLTRLFPKQQKILIFGTSRDKRSDRMFPYLAKVFKICILTRADNARAQDLSVLMAQAKGHFSVIIPALTSKEALATARKLARPKDLIVATGSFYLIGEIRSLCSR